MPDGNLSKVLRTVRQCVTRITGGGGLHSRLNQVQASLDTAQSRLRSAGIYSPPIQTALDHAKHAACSLDAYTQTEYAWEQAIGAGSSASTTQTIDATGNGGIINSQGDASALIVNNDETVVSSSTKNKSSGGTCRPGGVRDLEPAYVGVDARRGTSGSGRSPSGDGRGSGSNSTGSAGGTGHPGGGHYGPAEVEDPDEGSHNNHGSRGRYDASREPDTQEDRSHQNSETNTGRYYNRDNKGHFADGNGGSQDYELSEQAGMEQYRSDMKELDIEIGKEISSKHLASVKGTDHGRYFDRIIQLDDGTWVGLEIKSGSATRTLQQRTFDNLVSPDNPAKVTFDDGTTIYITKTDRINVARQEFPPAPENKGD